MDHPPPNDDNTVCSFILRLWLEDRPSGDHAATWRGVIVHVPSGQQQYLSQLDDITRFVRPYLENWGVRFNGDPPAP